MFSKIIPVLGLLAVSACGASQVSTLPVSARPSTEIRTIALDPSGGMVADAVGVQLATQGYNVVDTARVSQMMIRANMNEIQISQPQGLRAMAGQGIDALLQVQSSGAYDGLPEAASARVTDTRNGSLIAGATWQNGWGGQAGSMADRTMRKGLNEAANDIAKSLSQQLSR